MRDEYSLDEKEIEKRKQLALDKRRRTRDRELEDIKKVLSTPEGRRFIWRLMGESGVFRSSFTGPAERTYFNEGQRDIGLLILKEVNNAKPSAFAQMQNESLSEAKDKK